MDSKILISCVVLCIIGFCCGDKNTKMELFSEDSSESSEMLQRSKADNSNESRDLNKDASVWQFWRRLRNIGLPAAFSSKLTLPFKKETERRGPYFSHQDRPKIKNKVKLLFKLKQFET